MRKQVQELVHTGPWFFLNPESVIKSKDVYNYLKSKDLKNTRLILWHDVITNTITHHRSNNYQPRSVTPLLASLRSLTNFCGLVQGHRTPLKTGDRWTANHPSNDKCFEQQVRAAQWSYRWETHRFASIQRLELRSFGVVLPYYPNLRKILRTKGNKRRTHDQRREANSKREIN